MIRPAYTGEPMGIAEIFQFSPLARRVRRDEFQANFVKPDGLALCLDYWARWMRRTETDLGARGQACLRGDAPVEGEHEGYDEDTAYASQSRYEQDVAQATDAMIDSLYRHHRAAIYRRCSIANVWRFPNLDFATALPEAESELSNKLSKNIVTRSFFG